MIDVLTQRLSRYPAPEKQARLREYLQELILKLIEKSGTAPQLAFIGGTALRILYDLQRFSEDLDFSQVKPDFDFLELLQFLKRELTLYGFSITISHKTVGAVHGSFIKFSDLLYQLELSPFQNQNISIKLEVDTNPPLGYRLESTFIQNSFLTQVQHFDRPSLFSGKCHALLCRQYAKGRDYFDLLWFIGNKIQPNYPLLSAAYEQTHKKRIEFNNESLKTMFADRIQSVDFQKVIDDVAPFLMDRDHLRYFTTDSFLSVIKNWHD